MRILAFGDSLTAGFYEGGLSWAPYGNLLSDLLNVDVEHVGLSGWTIREMIDSADSDQCVDVCGRKWHGLRHKLRNADPNCRFTHVIILAGTNDLGECVSDPTGERTSLACQGLSRLHQVAREEGCVTVALTIPEHPTERVSSALQMQVSEVRQRLNQVVRDLSDGSNHHLIDVAAELPQAEQALWDDGLHFSQVGYERLGRIVAADPVWK